MLQITADHIFSTSSEIVSLRKFSCECTFFPIEQSTPLLFKLLLNVKASFPDVFQQHARIGTSYCFKNKKSKSFVLKVAERKNYVIPKGSIHLENASKHISIC